MLDGMVVIPGVFFHKILFGATEVAEAAVEAVLLRVLGDIIRLLGAGKLEGD